MITPRLSRRSLAHALQWRLLLLWVVLLLLPTLIAMLPISGYLGGLLDHSPHAKELIATMDGSTFTEVLRQLNDAGASTAIGGGFLAALLILLIVSPALAGAAVAAARSDEPLRTGALLRGAGENYGRMLRLGLLVSGIPLAVAAIPGGLAFKLAKSAAEKATLESQAIRGQRIALVVALVAFFLAQLTLDAGRAQFAAQPERRSAFLAWWSGVKLLLRRPSKVLGLGLTTAVVCLGLAAALFLLRLRIVQSGAGGVVLAFVLAQLAVAAVGWHRASRIIGLTELASADALDRSRFEMHPPRTSPPAPRVALPSEVLGPAAQALAPRADALAPPAAPAPPAEPAEPGPEPKPALSTHDGSGT